MGMLTVWNVHLFSLLLGAASPVTPSALAELLNLLDRKAISSSAAKQVCMSTLPKVSDCSALPINVLCQLPSLSEFHNWRIKCLHVLFFYWKGRNISFSKGKKAGMCSLGYMLLIFLTRGVVTAWFCLECFPNTYLCESQDCSLWGRQSMCTAPAPSKPRRGGQLWWRSLTLWSSSILHSLAASARGLLLFVAWLPPKIQSPGKEDKVIRQIQCPPLVQCLYTEKNSSGFRGGLCFISLHLRVGGGQETLESRKLLETSTQRIKNTKPAAWSQLWILKPSVLQPET